MDIRPNIGAAGRRFRYWFGLLLLAIAVGLAVMFVRRAFTLWRLVVFLPLAAGTASLLQVRRRTCVLRAAEGTVEDDAGHITPAATCDLEPSRSVAARIVRDAILLGAAGAALVAAL